MAATILKDNTLFQKWLADLCEMSSRIKCMRQALYDELTFLGTPGNWDHILTQIGMFSYTGLSPEQVASMRNDGDVYILSSGRISVAGLNIANVKHVAEAIDKACRKEII